MLTPIFTLQSLLRRQESHERPEEDHRAKDSYHAKHASAGDARIELRQPILGVRPGADDGGADDP
jgi:hypothetical protein